jgi:hypothetical protein
MAKKKTCVSDKISYLKKKEGKNRAQAVAHAINHCKGKQKGKKNGKY